MNVAAHMFASLQYIPAKYCSLLNRLGSLQQYIVTPQHFNPETLTTHPLSVWNTERNILMHFSLQDRQTSIPYPLPHGLNLGSILGSVCGCSMYQEILMHVPHHPSMSHFTSPIPLFHGVPQFHHL